MKPFLVLSILVFSLQILAVVPPDPEGRTYRCTRFQDGKTFFYYFEFKGENQVDMVSWCSDGEEFRIPGKYEMIDEGFTIHFDPSGENRNPFRIKVKVGGAPPQIISFYYFEDFCKFYR